MKALYTFILSLLSVIAYAQFSLNPATPYEVCNASGSQEQLSAFHDGSGGYYFFWVDKRSGNGEVYGQHLDYAGNPQWTANGKLIATSGGNITAVRAVAWQSGALVAWLQSGSSFADSIFVSYINSSGNHVWSQPTLIANAGGNFLYMTTSAFAILPNDSGATITHSYTYMGGSSGFTFNRVDFNGNLHWPVLNNTFGLQGYDYRAVSDGANGFYALSKGNGLGSGMFIQRFDMQGNALWANGLDVTTTGYGFGGNIDMIADEDNNLYVVWETNASKIAAAKVSPQGGFAWSSQRITLNDTASGYNGYRSSARLKDNNLYITWRDARSGADYSSVQKVDSSGMIQWPVGGVVADTINGYYCYPRVAFGDSGTIVNTYISNSMHVAAQRIYPDGSLSWTDGMTISSHPSWIRYADYVALDDNDGCNIVGWISFAENVYAAGVCNDGSIADVAEIPNNDMYSFYPNPADLTFTLMCKEKDAVASLFQADGRLVSRTPVNNEIIYISTAGLAEGIYILEVASQAMRSSERLVVRH